MCCAAHRLVKGHETLESLYKGFWCPGSNRFDSTVYATEQLTLQPSRKHFEQGSESAAQALSTAAERRNPGGL